MHRRQMPKSVSVKSRHEKKEPKAFRMAPMKIAEYKRNGDFIFQYFQQQKNWSPGHIHSTPHYRLHSSHRQYIILLNEQQFAVHS